MIEKSIYEDYSIDFNEGVVDGEDSYLLLFNNKRQLYLREDNSIPVVSAEDLRINDYNFVLFIGKYKGKNIYVANVDDGDNFKDLFEVYDIDKDIYLITTRAVLVRDWYINHQYCGRCGTKTIIDEKDMMLKCPSCSNVQYSRIAPAIIVAIEKDDKLLMAKHSYGQKMYSLIAGFVEAGESIEEAVYREVKEEVGINIKNLKYMRSQSWPFPNSLMLAFTAEYDSGEITVDNDEILDAKWFKKEEIPLYDRDISISYWLLENFINTH